MGYALLCLGALCVWIEYLMPAFATPYLHPYALIVVGVILALVGGGARETKWGRGAMGALLSVAGAGLAFQAWGLEEGFLAGASVLFLVALCFRTVYAEDI